MKRTILSIILTLFAFQASAESHQILSCFGRTSDMSWLSISVLQRPGKPHLMVLQVEGKDPQYSNTKISDTGDIDVRVHSNKFGLNFNVTDEDETNIEVDTDGDKHPDATNVYCRANNGNRSYDGLSRKELQKIALGYAKAVSAISGDGPIDEMCAGGDTWTAATEGYDRWDVAFNIPFGTYEEEYGECNGDPHYSITILLDKNGNLIKIYRADA